MKAATHKSYPATAVALFWIGVGLAIAFALTEIGFFVSLWLGIWLPTIDLHGIIVLMCRGFMVVCVAGVALLLIGGLLHKGYSHWEDD